MKQRLRQGRPLEAGGHASPGLADDLRAARQRAGLSQQALGEALGLSNASISRMEHGKTTIPIDVAERWAEVCGCHLQLRTNQPKPELESLIKALSTLWEAMSPTQVSTLWLLIDGWQRELAQRTELDGPAT